MLLKLMSSDDIFNLINKKPSKVLSEKELDNDGICQMFEKNVSGVSYCPVFPGTSGYSVWMITGSKNHIDYLKRLEEFKKGLNKIEREMIMSKQILVSFFCKIGAGEVGWPKWQEQDKDYNILLKPCDGDDIFEYLMSDNGRAPNDLKGDKKIWYYCCNEKHGSIEIFDLEKNQLWQIDWTWGGDSNNIIKFIVELFKLDIISLEQKDILIKECNFVKDNFNIHYDIDDYLVHKRDNPTVPWEKPLILISPFNNQ